MNRNLQRARRNKKDEFYTRTRDIENELRFYKDHFKDKVVFLNCDDPEESNFWKYFKRNFQWLGLKKLIATHYDYEEPTYKLEYNGKDIIKTDLTQNGDFRSPEAIEALEEADIICTNPPFSLFREYVAQLVEYDKDFLIMGNINAITYKEIFPLIKDNKMWLGRNANRTMEFRIPDDYERWNRIDEETGDKYGKVPGITWYTNMGSPRDRDELILYKEYEESLYPKYDNYDAINVDRVNHIPKDYYGVMGVPITFLTKHNSDQFEIHGQMANTSVDEYNFGYPFIDGKRKYARILIQRTEESIKQQEKEELAI